MDFGVKNMPTRVSLNRGFIAFSGSNANVKFTPIETG